MAGAAVAQDRSDGGRRAFEAGRYDEAISLLGAAADRGDEAAARLLGRALAVVGRYADAEQRLRAYLAAHSDARTLWLPLGDVLRDRGRLAGPGFGYGRAAAPPRTDNPRAAPRPVGSAT